MTFLYFMMIFLSAQLTGIFIEIRAIRIMLTPNKETDNAE